MLCWVATYCCTHRHPTSMRCTCCCTPPHPLGPVPSHPLPQTLPPLRRRISPPPFRPLPGPHKVYAPLSLSKSLGGLRPPNPPCFLLGGLRPPRPPRKSVYLLWAPRYAMCGMFASSLWLQLQPGWLPAVGMGQCVPGDVTPQNIRSCPVLSPSSAPSQVASVGTLSRTVTPQSFVVFACALILTNNMSWQASL
jgi:hypothetical protein